MKRCGVAFGIVFDFATVAVIGLDCGEAEECHRDIFRAGFADAGETEDGGGRCVAGDEIAVMPPYFSIRRIQTRA
jgi:hypothetical protein